MEALIKLLVFCTLVFNVQNSIITSDVFGLPKIDAWWGTEASKCEYNTSIRPFEVKFEPEMVQDLRYRLKNHRPCTPPLEGANFTYGFNTNSLEKWVNYWADSYNFTEREAHFNKFPHYKTNIQGLDIHFIWIKQENFPSGVQVIPLLMLHGWPGSIMEFYKAIPLLTAVSDDRDFVVELVVPSLPGFGFSSPAVRKGLGGSEMAVVLRNLMHRIGHKKFYIQGGDWGSHICKHIATLFPDEILGYHTNYAISYSPAPYAIWFMGSINKALQSLVVKPGVANRLYPLLNFIKGSLSGNGYMHLHATKPDTLGVALSDSPTGLLAYILQIVSSSTRSEYQNREDGGLYEKYKPEELIDDLMVYWVNNVFTSAIRVYAETYNVRNIEMGVLAIPTNVPTWMLQAKSELRYQSPEMLKFKFTNIVNTTVLETGGHFFALELPEIFTENVFTALKAFRQYWSKKIGC